MDNSCSLYLVSDGSLWVEKYYYIFVKEKAIENSSIAFWVYIVIHLVISLYYYWFVKNYWHGKIKGIL